MNIKVIALATILGLSAPAITDIAVGNHAVASRGFDYPRGTFTDQEWRVRLSYHHERMFEKFLAVTLSTY